jgi:lipopolysaccharide/colanic/teichoic acid biosynthesis glycosyltransferase
MQINPSLADARPESHSDAPTILSFRTRLEQVRGSETIRPLAEGWYSSGKAVLDFILAALISIPALPLIAMAALLVKLTSRGPVFYSQKRVGKDGRIFTIYKIRSMYHNCESTSGIQWSVPGDPRITPVGWFLRKSHIDELPQLLNVLRGEMSLIGPRPERPEIVPELEKSLPSYRQRLNVRPGVTGLAQVQLPPDTDLESVRRKLAHDLFYVRHVTFWLDVKLFICTAFYALGMRAKLMAALLGVPTSERAESEMSSHVDEPTPLLLRNRAA